MRLHGQPPLVALAAVLACAVLAGACGGTSQSKDSAEKNDRAETSSTQVDAPLGTRVVAAGDIACAPGQPVTARSCQQAATAELAKSLDPQLVLTLGDTQYPKSSLTDLMASYDKSWGQLLEKTRPTVGNHEYETA